MQKLIHVYLMKRLYKDNRNTGVSHGNSVFVCVCGLCVWCVCGVYGVCVCMVCVCVVCVWCVWVYGVCVVCVVCVCVVCVVCVCMCVCVCVCQPLCRDLAGRERITFSHVFPPRNNTSEQEDGCDSDIYPLSVWDRTDKSAAVDFTVQLSAIRVCLHRHVLPQHGFKVRPPGGGFCVFFKLFQNPRFSFLSFCVSFL